MRIEFNHEQYNEILKQRRKELIKEKLQQIEAKRINEAQKKANLDHERD